MSKIDATWQQMSLSNYMKIFDNISSCCLTWKALHWWTLGLEGFYCEVTTEKKPYGVVTLYFCWYRLLRLTQFTVCGRFNQYVFITCIRNLTSCPFSDMQHVVSLDINLNGVLRLKCPLPDGWRVPIASFLWVAKGFWGEKNILSVTSRKQ